MKLSDFIKESKVLLETRTPNQILMELNVINIPDIDGYLKNITKELPTEDLVKWFISRGKKHIINSEDQNTVINQFSADAEPWMIKAHKRKEVLYRFSPTTNLTTQLGHVVDYIRALSDTVSGKKDADQQSKSQADKKLKGLANMSMAQAIEASEKWTRELTRKKGDSLYLSAAEEKGLEPILDLGVYKWYKLTSASCLDREGKVMGHCVGSYSSDVTSGRVEIYSLRDANNMSRVTVEIKKQSGYDVVNQIKGKGNRAPVEKYYEDIIILLNSLKVVPSDYGSSDLRAMGLFFNRENLKYGKPEDIAEITYDKNDIKIYDIGEDIGKQLNYKGNKICYITGHRNYRGHYYVLKVENSNIQDFVNADVKTLNPKIQDPYYKLASFLVAISDLTNKFGNTLFVSSDVRNEDPKLKKYLGKGSDGNLRMSVDAGGIKETSKEFIIDEEYFEVQTNSESDGKVISFFVNGENVGSLSQQKSKEKDRPQFELKNVVKTDNYQMKLGLAMKTFVNEKKEKDRPIIYGENNISQNSNTYEIVERTSPQFDKVMGVRNFGDVKVWKDVYGHSQLVSSPHTRYHYQSYRNEEDRILYAIKIGTVDLDFLKIVVDSDNNVFGMSDERTDVPSKYKNDYIKALNSPQIVKFFTETKEQTVGGLSTVRSTLRSIQRGEIYWNPNKKVFSLGYIKSGDRFRPKDNILAIKTMTSIHIYEDEREIVTVSLGDDGMFIDSFVLKDKLSFMKNTKEIADIFNHYGISRRETSTFYTTNKELAALGMIYSKKEDGWKGQKSTGKEVVSNDDFSINQFKNSYIIKNKKTNEALVSLIAEVKRSHDGGVLRKSFKHLNLEKENIYEFSNEDLEYIFAAINEIRNIDETFVVNFSGGDYSKKLRDTSNQTFAKNHQLYFDHVAASNGFNPDTFEKNESFKEKSVVSKGKGGTWVKERISPIDLEIQGWLRGYDLNNKNQEKEWKSGDKDFSPPDSSSRSSSYKPLMWDNNYTLYFNKKPILRVLTIDDGNTQSSIFHIISDSNITRLDTEEEFKKFAHELGRLYNKENLPSSREMRSCGMFMSSKGKLTSMDDNPKLSSFKKGLITYEDGTSWRRRVSPEKIGGSWKDVDVWTLYRPIKDEQESPYDDSFVDSQNIRNVAIIEVNVLKHDEDDTKTDEIGIDSIKFKRKDIRRNTKLYRPFILDLMDILDEYHSISFT